MMMAVSSKSKQATKSSSSNDKINNLSFELWCHRKDSFDRGVSLIKKLDDNRWETSEDYEALTFALCAIDESLDVDADAEVRKTNSGGPAKTMFDVWKRASMENHAMVNVPLSKKNETELSETVKQYAEKIDVEVNGKTVQRLTLPQIKYMFPAIPKKKGDQVKPMSSDQKEMNAIFVQQLKRRWLKKRDEVAARAAKLSLALLDQYLLKEQSGDATHSRPSAADLKRKALYILGIGKLNKWVEEDEEAKGDKAKAEQESKRHEAAHAHEAFVRGKKALELHIPPSLERNVPQPPRFVFATGSRKKGNPAVPVRSKQISSHTSTVDMLRESGLKVVHALSAGKQGRDADLEKSRQQLEREGHISKRNYEDEEAYKEAVSRKQCGCTLSAGAAVRLVQGKKAISAVVEKRTRTRFEVDDGEGSTRVVDGDEVKRRGGESIGPKSMLEAGDKVVVDDKVMVMVRDMSAYLVSFGNKTEEVLRADLRLMGEAGQRQAAADDSYKNWIDQKRAKQLAGEFLKFISSPDEFKVDGELATVDEALLHWKSVGKHLKVIDRGLLDEWFEWSKGFEVTYYVCQVLWDSFEPIGDDVHTNYYSLARQTLGLLLRPGLKYKMAADKIVARKWRACESRGEDLGDLENATEEDLRSLKMFDRNDLKQMLVEVGLELRGEQLRLVVDAFDGEDEGKMQLDRFLEFTGPNGPTDRADANRRLRIQTPPVWESTCPKTGLSNAFRVTAISEGASRKSMTGGEDGTLVKIIQKKNGEKRQLVELKERKRRIAILRTFQELPEYSDDDGEEEEEGYSDDEDGEKSAKKCTVAQWNADGGALWKKNRRVSLRALAELSRSRRDESELQSLMEKGLPPVAPAFYAAGASDPEVVERRDPLERSLLLRWDSPPGSLVAFFSIEMSGPRGSKEQRENIFHEVCRDPDSARSPFGYSTWIHDLAPGTTYSFRIRAFNGFGPGPYTWKTFTTRPRCPNKPLMIARTPSSITLRWAGAEDTAERNLRDTEAVLRSEFPGFIESMEGSTSVSGRLFIDTVDRLLDDVAMFLKTTQGEGGVSLRDMLECMDDMNWSEVRSLVMKAASKIKGKQLGPATSQVQYVVEQCINFETGQWSRVTTTKFDYAAINALNGGSTYRFRVCAMNANGLESKKSPSCVYTTLLETPPCPRLMPSRPRLDGMSSLKIGWDPSAVNGSGLSQKDQRKHDVDRILSSWTQEGADDDGAVSLVSTFRRQQTYTEASDDEYVSVFDLNNLLEDLGCESSDAKRTEVLEAAACPSNASILSLQSIRNWWTSDSVTYELKRDCGRSLDSTVPLKHEAPVNIVCYRGSSGDGHSCIVGGLEPNFVYRFTIKVSTPKSTSAASKCLEASTAPAPMDPPVVVCASDPKSFSLKWYPPRNGTRRFVLEYRLVEALDALTDKHVELASKKIVALGWRVAFDGRDSFLRLPITAAAVAASGEGLMPNSVYQFRVTGVNSHDVNGVASEPILCRTPGRFSLTSTSLSASTLKPVNAHQHFTVECRGDVVVGDTIICTEQLMVAKDGKLNTTHRVSRSKSGLTFVGERTIAAHVLKDVYRSPKHSQEMGISSGSSRVLRLEVIWSTCSCEDAGPFLLSKGDIVERDEDRLAMFEIFRREWAEEDKRLPEARERILFKRTKNN